MFDIRERTDKITHSTSGNKLRVREREDRKHLSRKRIFITTCLACFFLSILVHSKFHTVQLLGRPILRLWYEHWVRTAVFTEANTCSKYWLVKCRGIPQCLETPEAICSSTSFLQPYVWLNKSTSFHHTWNMYDAKQGKMCCLQTGSYLIYLFNLCSRVVCNVRWSCLLHPEAGTWRSLSHWPSAGQTIVYVL